MYKSLREYMEIHKHPNGSYGGVNVNKETAKALQNFSKKAKIPNPVAADSYHATIIFSKKGVPAAKAVQPKLPLKAKVVGWEVFDTKMPGTGKCLVLRIESKELLRAHNEAIKAFGATYDYDEYKPHLTMSYSFKGEAPKELPKFEIVFDEYKFEPLKQL